MRAFRPVLLSLSLLFIATAKPASAQDAQSRLWDAAIAGDTAAIRQAVKEGANVDSLDTRTNRNGRRALNWAAWHDRADAVKVLLELKANIEGENITGFTALHHAAENGSMEAAKVLLAAGADVDHVNGQGMTALIIATERGKEGVAKLIEAAPKKKKQ
jgi:ankyrin repeat protein